MEGDQNLGGNEVADFPHSNARYKNCLTFRMMSLFTTTSLTPCKHNASVFITQILIHQKSQKHISEDKKMDDAILFGKSLPILT
jgi:hypothetical protein